MHSVLSMLIRKGASLGDQYSQDQLPELISAHTQYLKYNARSKVHFEIYIVPFSLGETRTSDQDQLPIGWRRRVQNVTPLGEKLI